jgi:hypothetical protein
LQVVLYMQSQGREAKFNPISDFDDDICIHVKGAKYYNTKHAYLDVVDWIDYMPFLNDKPDVGVIAITELGRDYLCGRTGRKDIKVVRQHHCNFDRVKREDREVTTVGFIGRPLYSFQFDLQELEKLLADRGLKFIWNEGYKTWEDVASFYKQMDIQVYSRVFMGQLTNIKDSLKAFNAGSFGIPTVAYPDIPILHEFKGCFVPAKNVKEMADMCLELKKDSKFYKEISEKALKKSEEKHISNIINDYYALE